jgi:type VI secretion system ImpH/TssG family protein
MLRTGPLRDRLLTRGWEFDFFQAVWLLERYGGGRTTVGGRGPVAEEAIRFRPDVWLGFPPTDVRRITPSRRAEGDDPLYCVEVTFLGLYGVSTPLPLHYAVEMLRSVEPDDTLARQPAPEVPAPVPAPVDLDSASTPGRDFLDIIHHRLTSLFYRSWTKYRYYATFGMPDRDRISDYLLLLICCMPSYDRTVLGVSPIRLLRYAGFLTQHPKSAVALEGLLSDYWGGLPVRIEQCVGRWVPLAASDLNRLGAANSRLGVDLTVGEQVYDLSGAFDMALGPVDWATYLSFLPGQEGFQQTRALARFYCADPLSFTLTLELFAGEIPEMRLSSDAEAGRLGFTSWVRTYASPETAVTFVTAGADA